MADPKNPNIHEVARRLRDCGPEARGAIMEEYQKIQPSGPGTAVFDLITRIKNTDAGPDNELAIRSICDETIAADLDPLVLTTEERQLVLDHRDGRLSERTASDRSAADHPHDPSQPAQRLPLHQHPGLTTNPRTQPPQRGPRSNG